MTTAQYRPIGLGFIWIVWKADFYFGQHLFWDDKTGKHYKKVFGKLYRERT